jgi:hypothetical protein
MTAHPVAVRRRQLVSAAMGTAAAAALPGRAFAQMAHIQLALAELFGIGAPAITVAGPDDSEAGIWARRLQPVLQSRLPPAHRLQLRFVGGRDGVTGANQFDARAAADGSQALMFPGTIAMPCLAGDSRVRFETAHLSPVMAAMTQGVVMMRGSLTARRSRPLRVACHGALEPGSVALLGFDLLAVPAEPVAAAPSPFEAATHDAADAVLLSGPQAGVQHRALASIGWQPAFALGDPASGVWPQSMTAPPLASLLAAGRGGADPLLAAWNALAAACLTPVALALPPMCPADAVARWRQACSACLSDPDIVLLTSTNAIRLVDGDQAASVIAAALAPADAQAAFRFWLQKRLAWRPA